MQWQPIETAPKGEAVLVLDTFYYRNDAKHEPHHVHRAAFFNEDGEWEECETGEVLDEGGPTHWMPLPDPPKEHDGERAQSASGTSE